MSSIWSSKSFMQKSIESLQLGWKHYPLVWIGFAYFFASLPIVSYKLYREIQSKDRYVNRFKAAYTVVRPDDYRINFHPKNFITDKQYLKPGHPETLDDVPFAQYPKTTFRKFYD